MAVTVPVTRKVLLSGPAITSAQVAGETTARPWITLMFCVLSPHLIWISAVRPSRVLAAENVTFVVPAPPEAGEMVSHSGVVGMLQPSVASTEMVVEPPSILMAT